MTTFDANFIANAGVKDIVGRGLIHNDNIALIELVKNSKDAGSPDVKIEFKTYDGDESFSEISIADTGSGMSQDEVIKKWLNIAYSHKMGQYEQGKSFAGSKGVGRFSCDRLGASLVLYTKTKGGSFIKLPIDWTKFEDKGIDDEISTVKLEGQILSRAEFLKEVDQKDFNTGTILRITRLREKWGAQRLKKLIAELEKFSPSLDETFSVYFGSDNDFGDVDLRKKINRNINNNILDKLSFRSTYIISEIDGSGEFIDTALFYQGEKIYSYRASNPFTKLKSIKLQIHYLDTITKAYFTRNIGVNPNEYGSVFLFYNGFRISPYGNSKNDWLGLDQRKSQGTSRNLGTRDIFGRIDIEDPDNTFSVITSREGLAQDAAYLDLVANDPSEKTMLVSGRESYGFVLVIIRQLENFVVSGLNWDRAIDKLGKLKSISAEDIEKDPSRFEMRKISKDAVDDVCNKILKSPNLSITEDNFFINKSLVKKIQSINDEKFSSFVSDFVSKSEDKSLDDLKPNEKGIVRRIVETQQSKTKAAEEERDAAETKTEQTKRDLEASKQERLYLLATRRTLSEDADGLIHTVKINSSRANSAVDVLIEKISGDSIQKEEILTRLADIKQFSQNSLMLTEIATRSGFDADIDVRVVDIVQYIVEYLELYKDVIEDEDITYIFNGIDVELVRSISVLNLSIVLDNLVVNSVKWGATKIQCDFEITKSGSLSLILSDDGDGLVDKYLDNPELIFELGVREEPNTKIGGSGIGLYYSRKLLRDDLNASVEFLGNGLYQKGACFKLEFK